MTGDVFISHSKDDRTVANAAVARLEGRGIRCWIAPRDITPGLDWSAEIIEAIERAKVMVLIYSAKSNASPQIKREVERAVSQGIPVVTFRLEDVPMNKSLEYFISTPHWLDALTPPLERHLDYLAETVQLLLSRRGPDEAPAPEARAPERPPVSTLPPPAAAPAPTIPTTPTPAPKRIPMIAVGGAAVLAVLGYVFFRPTAVSSAGVERQFAGTWVTHGVDKGRANDLTMTVDAGGHYQSRVVVTETGNITASNGQYRMVSSAGDQTTGTYGPVGPTSVTVTGPLGTADWKRKTGTHGTAGTLAGTWELTFPAAGATWNSTFDITPQGTYRLINSTEDAGTFEASNGSWQTVSQVQNGARQNGTYHFLGSRSVSMTGPLGTAVWNRQ
ncbi:MAG TPA: toll/interleukin-1 receptor domain-containing protein [Gemmatimonadales bacterium]|jgi:hypothetical protein